MMDVLQLQGQLKDNLEKIASERVDPQDHASKLARWNAYMDALDAIETSVKGKPDPSTGTWATEPMRGVAFEKNLTTNVNNQLSGLADFGASITAFALIGGIFIAIFMTAGLTFIQSVAYPDWLLYLPIIPLGAGIGGMLLMVFAPRTEGKLPEVVTASVKPEIHINELEYVHTQMKGLPEMSKDPVIYLPELTIAVPREYLITASVNEVMTNLSGITLPLPQVACGYCRKNLT